MKFLKKYNIFFSRLGIFDRYLKVISLTLLSQVSAFVPLFIMIKIDNELADIYATAVQSATACYAGFVIAILYSLALGRPNFRYWREMSSLSAILSFFLGCLPVLMSNDGEIISKYQVIYLILATGGVLLSLSGISAVKSALKGSPEKIASNTLFINWLFFCGVVLWATSDHLGYRLDKNGITAYVIDILPASLWLLGASFTLIRVPSQRNISNDLGQTNENWIGHLFTLCIGFVTSSVFPIFYLNAVSSIAVGTATQLFITMKIMGGITSLIINSILSVRYNWSSAPETPDRLAITLSLASAGMALVSFTLRLGGLTGASEFSLLCSLLLSLMLSPFLLREVNQKRMVKAILVKNLLDFSTSLLSLALLFNNPTIPGFLASYGISQAMTVLSLSHFLGRRKLFFISIALVASQFLGFIR